ncbi:MAG TPA: metallophosphoesterase [Bryobacteraceae bacterium]|nr:metallophosphoesterase [Bryobacteraceae bacterium]
MEFLHTADWQIGMKAATAGGAAAAVRQARLESAARVTAMQADFLLVAGDTFEDNAVDRALVQQTGEILSRFAGPVYLLPGNHDPLQPGSVWEHAVWRQYPNLHVVREAAAIPIPGGTLLATPLRETHSRNDPTTALAALPRPDGTTIAMSHGTVEGVDPDTEHHPIARQAAERARVAYLALGHWHSTSLYADAGGAVRMAYCGTHETTKFGERDSGNVLRVRLPGGEAPPMVEAVRTGVLVWPLLEEEVRISGDMERVRDRVAALPERALLRLELRGLLHPADTEFLRQIEEMRGRFLHMTLDSSALRPAAGEGWEELLPAGAVRMAARQLRERAAQGDAVAVDALLELQVLARQVGA